MEKLKFTHKKRPVIGYVSGYKNKMQLIARIVEWEKWALGQEKELRDIKKTVDGYPHDRRYMEGRSVTIKEILG